jgi:hypothetical protein
MTLSIHQLSQAVGDIVQIILDLHVLALLIVNFTETPRRTLADSQRYTFVKRLYRFIELLAGFITPLAKK